MNGYQGYRDYLNQVPADQRAKFASGRIDTGELQLLINGRNSALDIKKALDTQSETKADLQGVLNYLEVLALAGLIER
jgi:hypothetical protein